MVVPSVRSLRGNVTSSCFPLYAIAQNILGAPSCILINFIIFLPQSGVLFSITTITAIECIHKVPDKYTEEKSRFQAVSRLSEFFSQKQLKTLQYVTLDVRGKIVLKYNQRKSHV